MDTNGKETNAKPRSNKSRAPDAALKNPPSRARKTRKTRPSDASDVAEVERTPVNAETPNPPPAKDSKRPQKAPKAGGQPAAKGGSSNSGGSSVNVKKLAEDMILYRLDHWRARATVVYTTGQRDATPLWSPHWAGVVPQQKGYSLFDGFDRTWFIPFDISTPLPQDKQHIADDLQRRGKEMKEIFRAQERFHPPQAAGYQWDQNCERKDLPPMKWTEVRHKYGITELVNVVAIGRLADGRALLPGYYTVILLDLAVDGKMLFQRVNMPPDISLQGFTSRLESWSVSKSEDDENLLELDFQGSEMDAWVFKLNHNANYYIRPAQGPADIRRWKGLTEATFDEFVQGVRGGKHPVVVRPWKIRLRRMWPDIDELDKELPPDAATGEPELSLEQLDIVDELLAKHTDHERQQGKRFMQALEGVRSLLD
ncbi:hypothetical protein CEP52_005738 [Fusarium oligoseptatum]|uniref:Uncharacterized protein n=1 Tax=Fusarium oligoseptatum TaxID=2604345 RepID=A0A428TWH1_9HYPO|nr:hypothetical protein CEP52_005738 [Fusarium oligoseptatum]